MRGRDAGYCKCGCGGRTKIAPQTHRKLGYVKGQPVDYLPGHNFRGHKGWKMSEEGRRKISVAQRRLRPRGRRVIDKDGYVRVHVGRDHPMASAYGQAYEHRLVMAAELGRTLEPHEVVHHVNGDRADNRVTNLQLLESRSAHMVLHNQERANG
jgi:hypothetical protein